MLSWAGRTGDSPPRSVLCCLGLGGLVIVHLVRCCVVGLGGLVIVHLALFVKSSLPPWEVHWDCIGNDCGLARWWFALGRTWPPLAEWHIVPTNPNASKVCKMQCCKACPIECLFHVTSCRLLSIVCRAVPIIDARVMVGRVGGRANLSPPRDHESILRDQFGSSAVWCIFVGGVTGKCTLAH